MDRAGLNTFSRFDTYDTVETSDDLQALYEALSSVKDSTNRSAIFTPFALPCNIDFERMEQEDYAGYRYEFLPATYEKLSAKDPGAYESAWPLWREGIDKGYLQPQFHGREHLNLKVFTEKLVKKDQELMAALANRSYTSLSNTGYATIGYTAAFSFWSPEELKAFPEVLQTGLQAFEKIFGYPATVFTPPAQQFHSSLEPILWENGIKAIDKPFTAKQHLGNGRFRRQWNTTGFQPKTGTVTLVRNVVFEPTDDRGVDWVNYTLKQIEAGFRWNRPAIISSHRVNFCGHIDPMNRKVGLTALLQLLKKIVERWPEVEFLSAGELAEAIIEDRKGREK